MKLKFMPTTIFRETPKVTFFDAGLEASNGYDVVIHSEEAISPPDDFKDEQYYVHNPQISHIRIGIQKIMKFPIAPITFLFVNPHLCYWVPFDMPLCLLVWNL